MFCLFFQANHGKEKSWIPKLGNTHPNTDTGNFSCTTISSASSGSGIRVVKEEKSLEDSAFNGINFDEKLEAIDTWSSLGSYLAFKRATFLCSRIRCTSHLFAYYKFHIQTFLSSHLRISKIFHTVFILSDNLESKLWCPQFSQKTNELKNHYHDILN